MKLIVAEKPIAAARIASILGKPKKILKNKVECYELKDAVVIPLKGHITNIDFPAKYKSWGQTDLSKLINALLIYESTQKSIEKTLKEYAPLCDTLIASTDFDSEGESIAKEAIEIVRKKNPKIRIKRARFSALTPEEVGKAFEKPVDFDFNLADSADSRREIDLLWGAVLTRYISLTSKRLGKEFLSVGRVQTPLTALVVDREKEILAFKPQPFWVVLILCEKNGEKFIAVYEQDKIFEKKKAEKIFSLKFDKALIKKIEKKRLEIKPPSPFNTTEFLRAVSSMGFQPAVAMSIAEKLYMSGLISYPRCDNTVYPASTDLKENLKKFTQSKEFGSLAEKILKQEQIKSTRGKRFVTDHPPIHPVEVVEKKKLSPSDWKIYELVVRRFFSTLAPSSEIETVKVLLDYGGENFIASGKKIISAGWREFYPYLKIEEVLLPELKENEAVSVEKIECKEDKTKPKPRYTPAALIKLLEEKNLGTKSTRASILQKVIDRGYIQGRKNFTPSQIAFAVIDALEQYAEDVTKSTMTAKLEEEMQLVEKGQKKKTEVVQDSRKMLSKVLDELEENKLKIAEKLQKALREDAIIGKCSKCGGDLKIISSARTKKQFIGCSNYVKGCTNSYPLPQKAKIITTGETCEKCGTPIIKVVRAKKRPFKMCLDVNCPTKAGWKKKVKK